MITTVLPHTTNPIPAVIPQWLIPSPRYYRQLCPHYRGNRGNPVIPITVQLPILELSFWGTFWRTQPNVN